MKKKYILVSILILFVGGLKSQNFKRSGEYYYVMDRNNKDTIYEILVVNDEIADTTRIYTKIKSNKYQYFLDSNRYEIGHFYVRLFKKYQYDIPNHLTMEKIGIWIDRYPKFEYIHYFGLIFNYSSTRKALLSDISTHKYK